MTDCVLLKIKKERKVASETIENAVIAVSSKATYSGAGMTVGGWLLSSEFAVLAGLILGVASFALNWFYRFKKDRREHIEHLAKMKALK
jgi:hypothetical protein